MGKMEQLEYQRKNPHLFTTLTQSVNPDGTLVDYFKITAKLQETEDKLVSIARARAEAKNFNPDYWFLMDELSQIKEMTDLILADKKRCQQGFVENYARIKELL